MFSKRLYIIASTCRCQPLSESLCRHVSAKPNNTFVPNHGKLGGWRIMTKLHDITFSNVIFLHELENRLSEEITINRMV